MGKAGPNKNFQSWLHIRIHWEALKKYIFLNSTHDDPGSIDQGWVWKFILFMKLSK